MPATIERRRFGTTANVWTTIIVFASALLLMALFLSADLQSYAYDLPVNPVTETIVSAVDTWHGWMEALGTARLADAIAFAVSDLHDARFQVAD